MTTPREEGPAVRVLTKIIRLELRIKPADRTPRHANGHPLPVLSAERRARAERIIEMVKRPDGGADWSKARGLTPEEHI